MAKVYPYGFFFRSSTDLTDGSGNYAGNSFKIPAFLDTVLLDSFSGNIVAGNFVLEKNGTQRYPISLGTEREILVEPGDSFRLLIESGDASNVVYNYQLGFRYAGREDGIELSETSQSSESSIVEGAFAGNLAVPVHDDSSSSEFDIHELFAENEYHFIETQIVDNLGTGTFGNAIAVSDEFMVVGNRASDEIYIYEREDDKWGFSEIIKPKHVQRNDGFGYAIKLHQNQIIVSSVYANIGGNKNQGAVYIFEKRAGSWTERQKLITGDGGTGDMFGSSISVYGNIMVVGAPGQTIGDNEAQGAAYVYEASGSFWNLSEKLHLGQGSGLTEAYDKFGHSVSVNHKMVAVGAPGMGNSNTGRVLIYKRHRDGSVDSQASQVISGVNQAQNDMFGFHVESLYDRVYVSALGQNGQRGAIEVFIEDNSDKFKYSNSIMVSDVSVRSQFGYSFEVTEDLVIVGARNDSLGRGDGSNCGSVYVFRNNIENYEQIEKLTASDSMAGHRFGHVVAYDRGMLAINASGAGKYGNGSIYILEQSGM